MKSLTHELEEKVQKEISGIEKGEIIQCSNALNETISRFFNSKIYRQPEILYMLVITLNNITRRYWDWLDDESIKTNRLTNLKKLLLTIKGGC